MCGRYTLSKTEHLKRMMQEAGYIFDEFSETRLTPRFNVSPGQLIPVGLHRPGPVGTLAMWGLRPPFVREPREAFAMINARAETVATKPAYRAAFKDRRCVLPADGFYEFLPVGKLKQPIRFTLPEGQPFFFPGLWEDW